MTTCADDILAELNIEKSHSVPEINSEIGHSSRGKSSEFGKNALDNLVHADIVLSIERRVVDLLEKTGEPIHVDDISRALGEPASTVNSVLVMLELRGSARQVGSIQFIADSGRPVIPS